MGVAGGRGTFSRVAFAASMQPPPIVLSGRSSQPAFLHARLARIDERDHEIPLSFSFRCIRSSDLLHVPNATSSNTSYAWRLHYACRLIVLSSLTSPKAANHTRCHSPPIKPPLVTQPQVYFVVALFRAAQPSVMEAASKGLDLTGLLGGGEALEAFNLEESLSFMEGLERRHRKRCIAATRAYLAQC